MAKLFALEEQDLETGDGEMETSAEEGEVAVVDGEMSEDMGEITETAAGVDDGVAAGGQLEEVEELVADSVESGEGLDPVAAEAVRIAIEAISARVGYNPKNIYSLYSTENFQSSSSRLANSKIALEGIGEFLKSLWEKIKEAVMWVIKKVKDFYAKYITGLGRVTRALEAVKKQISANKGSIKVARIKAPGFLKSAFPSEDFINEDNLQTCVDFHGIMKLMLDNMSNGISKIIAKTVSSVEGKKITPSDLNDIKECLKSDLKITDKEKQPPRNKCFVGGVYFKAVISDEGVVSQEKKTIDKTTSETIEMGIADKAKLTSLTTSTIKLIADTHKYGEQLKKVEKAFSTGSLAVDKRLIDIEKDLNNKDNKDNIAVFKRQLRGLQTLTTMTAKDVANGTALNVKLAFAVVGYVKANLKEYKVSK